MSLISFFGVKDLTVLEIVNIFVKLIKHFLFIKLKSTLLSFSSKTKLFYVKKN